MKILLRVLAAISLAVVALLVALCLYLAFGDLGGHKGRIEQFVSQRIGREFAIDGPFSLKVIPEIRMQAEQVRVGNAAWGSTPQMLQVGRVAATIELWSLVSGPINVRTLELRDVTVTLERDRNGSNNWTFVNPNAPKPPPEESDAGLKKLPLALQRATLSNLRVTYRVPDQKDRIASGVSANLGHSTHYSLGGISACRSRLRLATCRSLQRVRWVNCIHWREQI